MNKYLERLYNGIIKENPTFILMLGMCPTLAVTSSAKNGMGMGLTTTAVLILSNMMISALRKVIPDKVRIPAFIVVVASFVTIVQLVLQAYIPFLYDALGIYIPLIVVNCIILGRAESYASKNPVLLSACDGIGMGLGFTVGLTLIGIFRELLGSGAIFGFHVMPASYEPITIFVLAPGAFFVLAMLTAIQNKLKLPSATNGKAEPDQPDDAVCSHDCSACGGCLGKTGKGENDA
ncbi:MAG: electron transport complex subunit E [Lachnospiraceae bacterium]|nr:electron transport complex subunit E [Lachnospiraceae bacterium]